MWCKHCTRQISVDQETGLSSHIELAEWYFTAARSYGTKAIGNQFTIACTPIYNRLLVATAHPHGVPEEESHLYERFFTSITDRKHYRHDITSLFESYRLSKLKTWFTSQDLRTDIKVALDIDFELVKATIWVGSVVLWSFREVPVAFPKLENLQYRFEESVEVDGLIEKIKLDEVSD